MRVLVIEDDDAVRAAVRRALLLGGYEVLLAENGEQGLLQAQSDVPDAIILDLGLPDIDGMQVTRTLRSSGDRTPILMLTARDAIDDRVGGLEGAAWSRPSTAWGTSSGSRRDEPAQADRGGGGTGGRRGGDCRRGDRLRLDPLAPDQPDPEPVAGPGGAGAHSP